MMLKLSFQSQSQGLSFLTNEPWEFPKISRIPRGDTSAVPCPNRAEKFLLPLKEFACSPTSIVQEGGQKFWEKKKRREKGVITKFTWISSLPLGYGVYLIRNLAKIVFKEAKKCYPSKQSLTFTHPRFMDFHGRKNKFQSTRNIHLLVIQ